MYNGIIIPSQIQCEASILFIIAKKRWCCVFALWVSQLGGKDETMNKSHRRIRKDIYVFISYVVCGGFSERYWQVFVLWRWCWSWFRTWIQYILYICNIIVFCGYISLVWGLNNWRGYMDTLDRHRFALILHTYTNIYTFELLYVYVDDVDWLLDRIPCTNEKTHTLNSIVISVETTRFTTWTALVPIGQLVLSTMVGCGRPSFKWHTRFRVR